MWSAARRSISQGDTGRLLLRDRERVGARCWRADAGQAAGQARHARPRRQLRRGGAAQGRAAQRHGAHDRGRAACSSSARRTSTACSRASCCTRSPPQEARRNSIAAAGVAHRLPLRGGMGAVAAEERAAHAARGDPRALARPRPQARVHRLLPHRPASRAAAFLMRQAGLNAHLAQGRHRRMALRARGSDARVTGCRVRSRELQREWLGAPILRTA